MTDHVVADAVLVVRHATIPAIAGIGMAAELAGNRVVLIGAVIAAAGVISRTALTLARRLMAVASKLDATWENTQKIPELVESIDELKGEKARMNKQLDELVAARNPRARTRSTDPEVTE
jgi:hypothetical protein